MGIGIKKLFKEIGLSPKIFLSSFILFLVVLKAIFYNEPFFNLFSLLSIFYFLFFLPNYILLSYIFKDINALEKTIFSISFGIAFFGVISYNLSLMGIHIRNQLIVIGIIFYIIAIAALLNIKKHILKD